MVKRFIERFQLWREQRAAEFEDAPKITDYHLLYGYIGLALGFGVTALLLIIFTRGRLGYQHYRSEQQGRASKD